MDWDAIRCEWESSEITFKDLAEKHGVKDTTIRSRKNRERWQRNDATQRTTKTKSVATEKRAKPQETPRKRSGNPNPKNQFTKRNTASRIHGLRSKYFNDEQAEIMEDFSDSSIVDQLWLQIEIKFSAIIRMQKIMWVETDDDHLKVESGYGSSTMGDSTSYKVAFAFERYEAYIRAQTRAMAEYRNLVKQYIELTDEFDERRLKLEGMQLGINKTKAEIEKLNDKDDDGPIEIMISRKGGR